MTSDRRRSHSGRAGLPEDPCSADDVHDTLSNIQPDLGTPYGVVSLAPLPPGAASAGQARLWLPPDFMFALKLPTGGLAAVALVGAGPGAAAQAHPLSLRNFFQQQLSITPSFDNRHAPTNSRASGGRAGLGEYVVLAELWPAPRLAKGTAAASPVLRDALGRPGAGAQLALFTPPASAAAGEQPDCGTVFLRLCTMQGHFASAPAVLPPWEEGCEEADPAGSSSRGGGGDPHHAAAAASPAALSPAMRAGARQPVALSPAMRGSGGGTPLNLGGKGGQPPKTPPRPATPASTSGSRSAGEKAVLAQPSALQAAAVLAMLQDPGSRRSRLRGLVEGLLLRHLSGRRLLPGNFVAAPVLGQQAVFLVERIAHAPAPSSSQPGMPAERDAHSMEGRRVLLPLPVTLRSKVHLLGPEEEGAEGEGEDGLHAAAGGVGSSGVQHAGGAGYAEAAAAAAAKAVGSGMQGAAAAAAAKAAAAGAGSAGMEFGALGGAAGPKQALQELVALPLRAPHLFARYHVAPPRGILLYGPPGTGKTVLARAAASCAGAKLFVINGPDVVSEYYGESEAGLRGVFAAAKALAPSVVFIDELDAIAPSRGGAAGAASKSSGGMAGRLVTGLLMEMDGLQDSRVVLVGATNRPDAIDPALRRPGRFDREVEIGVPSPADRRDILHKRLMTMRHELMEHQIAELADAAHGFVPADLAALCNEAALAALRRVQHSSAAHMAEHGGAEPGLCVSSADFAVAETRVRPSAMREVAVEVPKVRWEDVGGLEEVKQRLKEAVEWPFKHPEALARLGAKAPKGILLHGPPGCSKTLLARAVASQAKLNFLSIKGPELYNKYVGESEKAIATLFARARASSPSIIFFDELDGLATNREDGGEGGVSVGERVLSQLLQEMDGLQARQSVIVIAATNRLDCIDPALTRPGRFDRMLHVPPPDAMAREAILQVHTRCMPVAADVNFKELASKCLGFSGADVMALCREAALVALEADLGATSVSMRDFQAVLAKTQPSFC